MYLDLEFKNNINLGGKIFGTEFDNIICEKKKNQYQYPLLLQDIVMISPFIHKQQDEGVVEERRIRLQLYVRQVVNLLLNTHPQLASSPDKATLTSLLPFFA